MRVVAVVPWLPLLVVLVLVVVGLWWGPTVVSASASLSCADLSQQVRRQHDASPQAQQSLRECVTAKCLQPGGGLPCARSCEQQGLHAVLQVLVGNLSPEQQALAANCKAESRGESHASSDAHVRDETDPLSLRDLQERKWANNIATHCTQEVCRMSRHPLVCQRSCVRRHQRYKRYFEKCQERSVCSRLAFPASAECTHKCVSRRIEERLLLHKQLHRRIRALKYNAQITDARRRELLHRAYKAAQKQADAAAKAAQEAALEAQHAASVAATSRMEHLRALATMRRQEAVVACAKHHIRSGRCAYLRHIIDKFGNDKYHYKGRESEYEEEQSQDKSPLSSKLEKIAEWKDEPSQAVVRKRKQNQKNKKVDEGGTSKRNAATKKSSAPGPVKSKGQERVTKELKREQQSLEKKQGGKRSEKRVSRSVKREERKKDRKIHSETKTKKRRMRNKYKMDKKALKETLRRDLQKLQNAKQRESRLQQYHKDAQKLRESFRKKVHHVRDSKKFKLDLAHRKAAVVDAILRRKKQAFLKGLKLAKSALARQSSLQEFKQFKKKVKRLAAQGNKKLKEAEAKAKKLTKKLHKLKDRIQQKKKKVAKRKQQVEALRQELDVVSKETRQRLQAVKGDEKLEAAERQKMKQDTLTSQKVAAQDQKVVADVKELTNVVKAQKETQKKIAQDDARARKALKKNKKSMIELVARKKALEKRAAALRKAGLGDRAKRLEAKASVVLKDLTSIKSVMKSLASRHEKVVAAKKKLDGAQKKVKELNEVHGKLQSQAAAAKSVLKADSRNLRHATEREKKDLEVLESLNGRSDELSAELQRDADFKKQSLQKKQSLMSKFRRLQVATLRAKKEYGEALVQAQKASAELSALRKLRNPKFYTFVNSMAQDVVVSYINSRGEEVKFLQLKGGSQQNRMISFKHPWVIRDAASGRKVSLYLPTNAREQKVRV